MRSIAEWEKIEQHCQRHSPAEILFTGIFAAFALGAIVAMLAIRFL